MSPRIKYPSVLMPYHGLKLELNINQLLDEYEDFPVARRVVENIDDITYDLGDGILNLKMEYQMKHFKDPVDMSMNIITSKGGWQTVKFIQEKKPAFSSWEGDNVDVSSYKDALKYSENAHCIVYNALRLHNQPGSYSRQYKDREGYEKDKAITAIDEEFSSTKTYTNEYMLVLHHKPTNCNYWHITLDICAPFKDGKKIVHEKYRNWMDASTSTILTHIWSTYLGKNVIIDSIPCKELPVKASYDKHVCGIVRCYNKYKTKLEIAKVTL